MEGSEIDIAFYFLHELTMIKIKQTVLRLEPEDPPNRLGGVLPERKRRCLKSAPPAVMIVSTRRQLLIPAV